MSFAENPIINSPFEKPEWHFELDADGQPTGKKLPGRRNSVYVVPVAASRRRGPIQRELTLFEEEGGTRVHELQRLRPCVRFATAAT
jgi:type III restriction enzyme